MLRLVAQQLSEFEIIGVDIENNQTESYSGYICLIQLSSYNLDTGEIKTYVIDVLVDEVADSFVEILGATLFENPNVLKLLHGCVNSDL